MHAFRQKHLFLLLQSYEPECTAIDFHVSCYFRAHKALGSKDRAFIAEEVYRFIRWKGLVDYRVGKDASLQEKIQWLCQNDPKTFIHNETIPEHVRVSMPKVLFSALCRSFDKDEACRIALCCNEMAPTCIRVNTLKIDRASLMQKLKEAGHSVSAGQDSDTAIYFQKKCNFFTLDAFRQGFFEVQDEASQQVAHMIEAKPEDHVLDFCSGSGGKTLGFAPNLDRKGQIFLHDIRKSALIQAKKRLKRAGIQNAQTVIATDTKRLKKCKKRMNWVLVDAPCSGTGTLRRNPDMKWKFSEKMLKELVTKQQQIFAQALDFVTDGGYIVYATCSILKEENDEQCAHFLKTYPIALVGDYFRTIPLPGKKDGFFAAKFRKI